MTATMISRPWWKEPYVWMVIAGPASAVVACAITAVYIWQGPDAVVSKNYYREGLAPEDDADQPHIKEQHGEPHAVQQRPTLARILSIFVP